MPNRNTRSNKAKYKTCRKLLQSKCRELKNKWWTAKAAVLPVLADTNNIRGFYQNMKEVWGPRVNHTDILLASDNTILLTENQEILS